MTKKNLHPSVKEFKEFVKKHPGLVKKVKENNESWQDYYEKWVLLGEDDAMWKKYEDKEDSNNRSETSKSDKQDIFINQFMKMVENVDLEKVQGHIHQLNGAITNINSLIGQFQDAKKQFSTKKENKPPFYFNRD